MHLISNMFTMWLSSGVAYIPLVFKKVKHMKYSRVSLQTSSSVAATHPSCMSTISAVVLWILTAGAKRLPGATCASYASRHGGARRFKHPPNHVCHSCRWIICLCPASWLPLICPTAGKKNAAFELSLTIPSPYRILSLTYDLVLYIWRGCTPHTTSNTGTPRRKASRRTARAGNPLDVV